jgi:anti-sigma factor RsiW
VVCDGVWRRGMSMGRVQHISDDDLELYLLDRMSDEEARMRIEKHLAVCARCRGRGAATQEYVDALLAAMTLWGDGK